MKAVLRNYRQAPRKVRLVAQSVKGKTVAQALAELSFMPKRAAEAMAKLIKSAAANAKDRDASVRPDDLVVEQVTVNKGITFMRYMPRARGRASAIRKETSHVHVMLRENQNAETKNEKAPAKKTSAKK